MEFENALVVISSDGTNERAALVAARKESKERKAGDNFKKKFDYDQRSGKLVYLDLGTVHDMARVKLNGKDLGVVWCAPWRVNITDAVKAKGNMLEIEVANRWPNRLLGDQRAPDSDVRTVQWESGFLEGKEYKTGRYTFTTGSGPGKLLPSGLLGPVRILVNLTERK